MDEAEKFDIENKSPNTEDNTDTENKSEHHHSHHSDSHHSDSHHSGSHHSGSGRSKSGHHSGRSHHGENKNDAFRKSRKEAAFKLLRRIVFFDVLIILVILIIWALAHPNKNLNEVTTRDTELTDKTQASLQINELQAEIDSLKEKLSEYENEITLLEEKLAAAGAGESISQKSADNGSDSGSDSAQ